MENDVKPPASPEVIRWSVSRKKEVVLRMMRGEPIDALSRELGIEVYRLEKWHRAQGSGR
jgi:transposase